MIGFAQTYAAFERRSPALSVTTTLDTFVAPHFLCDRVRTLHTLIVY